MTKTPDAPKQTETPTRAFPTIEKDENGDFTAKIEPGMTIETLMGTRTAEAANGIYVTAVSALGVSAEKFCSMTSAMFAELEPRDAIEAMLVAQMTATHVAMTALSERATRQITYQGRESTERSMTRLSRTYLAQMDAFKKYRSNPTPRVEFPNSPR